VGAVLGKHRPQAVNCQDGQPEPVRKVLLFIERSIFADEAAMKFRFFRLRRDLDTRLASRTLPSRFAGEIETPGVFTSWTSKANIHFWEAGFHQNTKPVIARST